MDILALPNDTLVAAYNDSPTRRTPLVLAISQSGGQNWTRVATIEDDPVGSFHYPALLYDRVKVRSTRMHACDTAVSAALLLIHSLTGPSQDVCWGVSLECGCSV